MVGGLIALANFIVVAVYVYVYAIIAYNSLVMHKYNVSKAWANIDILLKQRHDELSWKP